MFIVTAVCSYICIVNHTTIPVFLFFWFKIIVDILLFYLWYNLRPYQLYYYYNLGLRKRVLFSSAVAIDLFVFIVVQIPVVLWIA
jgi:hypothetical protein